jgi:uncharacterized membrane protein YhiD involved in acid resistance
MFSLQDLFNQDIQELNIPLETVLFNITILFLLSLVILFMYKRSYQTTVYNRSFAIGLPIIAMVTSIIIIAVASNIILSLGMVGALSIIRFRTALKNPFDTVFMFWAVGLGITVGAGLIYLAIISTIVISLAIWALISLEVFVSSYFLIIRLDSSIDEEQVLKEIKSIYKKYTLKNKTVKDSGIDLTLEVRSKEDKALMINQIKEIKSVRSVILLSHNGDYISD